MVSARIEDTSAGVFVTRADCLQTFWSSTWSLYLFVLINRERGTAMCYCLQAYWLAKVQPNQTEDACARLAVSLDRLQNIEEAVLATRIWVWEWHDLICCERMFKFSISWIVSQKGAVVCCQATSINALQCIGRIQVVRCSQIRRISDKIFSLFWKSSVLDWIVLVVSYETFCKIAI